MRQAPIALLVMATLFIAACSEAPETQQTAGATEEALASAAPSAIGQIDDARINNADS